MNTFPVAYDVPAPAPLPLALTFRRVRLEDLPRVRGAFAEGYKHAPGVDRMPWRYYKQWVVPGLHAVLAHPTTELLGAYAPDSSAGTQELCGWIAYSRRYRSADNVHWVSVPYYLPLPHTLCIGCDPGERGKQEHAPACPFHPSRRTPIRRRGIMRALFDATGCKGQRLVYTHRGARHQHRNDGVTMDERLLPWLRARGYLDVQHMKWEEWSR